MTNGAKGLRCPVCDCADASTFIEPGEMPVLIGVLHDDADAARSTPRGEIRLAICPACAFIWNTAFDPARLSYGERYDNTLHFSEVFQEYSRALARRLVESYGLRDKTVVEVGCGGGEFLAMLCAEGVGRGIGFDPAHRGGRVGGDVAGRISIRREPFDKRHADIDAELIASRYVLEHVPQPLEFLRAMRSGLDRRPETIVYCEVPSAGLILRDLSVWDIIYEHCSYFSPPSLARVFEEAGFDVLRLEETYGGQMIAIDAAPTLKAREAIQRADEVAAVFEAAQALGDHYRRRLEGWRTRLRAMHEGGRRVVAWGAGAKAVGFLNMLGVNGEIGCVVDINPDKQGRHLPGTGHQVIAPDELRRLPPDALILMNPIYRNEVEARLHGLNIETTILEA